MEELIKLYREELTCIRDFLKCLEKEKREIAAFSLEGIAGENDAKELLLEKLKGLQAEIAAKESDPVAKKALEKNPEWKELFAQIELASREASEKIDVNMKLLEFSLNHVKSSIENIVSLLNNSAYRKRKSR